MDVDQVAKPKQCRRFVSKLQPFESLLSTDLATLCPRAYCMYAKPFGVRCQIKAGYGKTIARDEQG